MGAAAPPAPTPLDGGPYAWFMVLLAAIFVGVGRGCLLTVTLFLAPLEAEFGWLRAETSFAYGLGNIMAGVGGVAAGWWADRVSTRSAVLFGTFVLGGSLVALALMRSRLEFYILYGVILGGFALSTYLAPLVTSIGFWFSKNRGLATSLTLVGQSAGSALIPPLAGYLILLYSWREAYLLLGLMAWVVLLPLCFLLREPPGIAALKAHARAQHGTAAAGPTAISPRLLVTLLSLQTITISFCLTIPVVHLVPLVMSYGYDTTTAASVYSTIFIAGIVGRVLLGKLMDLAGGLPALIIATGLPALTIFGLTQVQTLPLLFGVTAVFGFGFGGVLGTYSVIIRALVPPHLTGRSVGWVFFWGYLALGVGGYVGGVLYDATGDYLATYAVGAASGLISLATAIGLTLFVHRRQAGAAANRAA